MLTSRFWTPDASGSAVPELWFSQGARARGLTYGDLGARAARGGAGGGARQRLALQGMTLRPRWGRWL